jgi:beta-1,4-mannosyltransferase
VAFLPADPNPYQHLLADALRAHDVEVRLAPGPRRITLLPITAAWLGAGRPPVIHLHWTHRYLGRGEGWHARLADARFLAELRILRALRVRIVWTVHNLGGHDGRRSSRDVALHHGLVRAADAVICHCQAARVAVTETYQLTPTETGRLHVIAHGNYIGAYPDEVDRAAARTRLGLPDGSLVLLFLGQLRRYKGVEDLIACVRRMDQSDLRLVIAGRPVDASMEAALRAAAEGDPRISMDLRSIPADEVQIYLRAGDAVVLPFRDVLTSGSAVLAMSFGRAVIAPRLGCLPETLGDDAAILYDPTAPDGLRDALLSAATADLRRLGEAAAARAAALGWDAIATSTAALYRG